MGLLNYAPFTYIVVDFEDKEHEVKGFFPDDVRTRVPEGVFLKRIEGPVVTDFKSWLMYQIVNKL